LAAAAPDNPGYQSDLSVTYGRLADLAADARQPAQAEQLHRQALAISQRLAAAAPDNPGYQRNLAITYERLGSISQQAGATSEAADWFTRALKLRRRLNRDNPARMDLAEELGVALRLYAQVLDDDSDLRREARRILAAFAQEERLTAKGRAVSDWAHEGQPG